MDRGGLQGRKTQGPSQWSHLSGAIQVRSPQEGQSSNSSGIL